MRGEPMSRRPIHILNDAHTQSRLLLSGVAMVLVVAVAGSSDAQGGTITKDHFVYLGAFKLQCIDDACSYNLTDLGSAPNGGLWVTDHVYDYAVRRIGIPAAPLVSQVFDDLPEAPTLEGPLATGGCPGSSTCYGEAVDCGDPCRSSKGYHGYPYTPKILFYDPADIEARLRGEMEPYQILPYAEWIPAELWAQECPAVGGMAFDESSGRLYVAEQSAGPFGKGVIHVYQLEDFLFADSFESGDLSVWSAAQQ